MLKVKLQYFGHLIWSVDSFEKNPDAGRDWGQEEKGTTEDKMAGWHHWLNGHEFGWTAGVGDGQGDLACCSPWGHKKLDTTELLNWLNWTSSSSRWWDSTHKTWVCCLLSSLGKYGDGMFICTISYFLRPLYLGVLFLFPSVKKAGPATGTPFCTRARGLPLISAEMFDRPWSRLR